MATTSKRSGGSRGAQGGGWGGAAPPPFHSALTLSMDRYIEFHRPPPPIALIPKSQQGPMQRIGNEGVEFHALTALKVKEMVSGRWLLSTPFKGLSVATRHSFLGLGLCNPALF